MIESSGFFQRRAVITSISVLIGFFLYVLFRHFSLLTSPFLVLFGLVLFIGIFTPEFYNKNQTLNSFFLSLLICFIFLNFLLILENQAWNLISPRQWDFFDFFVTSKVASKGQNFYSPELFHSVSLPKTPGGDFINEVLNVGSKYPPQTVLFFLPFGFFSFYISLTLFFCVQLLFLILSGIEIRKIIANGKDNMIIAFIFLFLISGTWKTMEYVAPNFVPLYFVLKAINTKSDYTSGILIGLAVIFRPLFLILFIDFILRKRWKHITGVFISIAATTVISLIIFGPDTCMNYFIDGPFKRVPVMDIYSHHTFCSINALLLRDGIIKPIWGSPLFHPFTLVYVGIIVAFIIYVLFTIKTTLLESICFLLPWAVLLYPETWWSYTVFLIFPLINLYLNKEKLNRIWFLSIAPAAFMLVNDYSFSFPEKTVFGILFIAIGYSAWHIYRARKHEKA